MQPLGPLLKVKLLVGYMQNPTINSKELFGNKELPKICQDNKSLKPPARWVTRVTRPYNVDCFHFYEGQIQEPLHSSPENIAELNCEIKIQLNAKIKSSSQIASSPQGHVKIKDVWDNKLLLMEEILHQLRLVEYPIIYRVRHISGGCLGFQNYQQQWSSHFPSCKNSTSKCILGSKVAIILVRGMVIHPLLRLIISL